MRVDLKISAGLICAAIVFIVWSQVAAEASDRRTGLNIDSGTIPWMLAIGYFIPISLCFALSALSDRRQWPIAQYVRWVAAFTAVAPILVLTGSLFAP
jgi:hypothetical protein